jgi:hypothetical protein
MISPLGSLERPLRSLIGRWCLRVPRPRDPIDRLRLKAARRAETEPAPIRYWAELVGTDADTKPAVRWVIALR